MEDMWMQLQSGKPWTFLRPKAQDVHIKDIAHALSNLCRYGGHTSRFYSVAEHSLIMSHLVPFDDALAALLHDATEAYLVDMPRPLKHILTNYKMVESITWAVIAQRFGLPVELPSSVKRMDNAMLHVEREQLLAAPSYGWMEREWGMGAARIPGPSFHINCMAPPEARTAFLERFSALTK